MSEYIGCDHAQDLLEGMVDGELSMADQLAVESHLRWCQTCALRVEDLRLIGSSLRVGSSVPPGSETDQAITAINEAVLMRVRAERDQSWPVRVRDIFSDMRLLWPAVGATAAVAVCVLAAGSVLYATGEHREESLASMITTLANPAPIRPAENGFFGISIPRPNEDDAKRAGGTLDALPDDDLIYTVRTVVDQQGRMTNFEVLLAGGGADRSVLQASQDRAVLDAIAQTRFAAAHTALGQPVTFDMVWVIAKTTAVAGPAVVEPVPARPAVKAVAPKPVVEPAAPAEIPRSSTTVQPFSRLRRSATA